MRAKRETRVHQGWRSVVKSREPPKHHSCVFTLQRCSQGGGAPRLPPVVMPSLGVPRLTFVVLPCGDSGAATMKLERMPLRMPLVAARSRPAGPNDLKTGHRKDGGCPTSQAPSSAGRVGRRPCFSISRLKAATAGRRHTAQAVVTLDSVPTSPRTRSNPHYSYLYLR